MKSYGKLMWAVWFVTAFAAFHAGLAAFGFNLLSTELFTTTLSFLVRPILILFGVCGLISMISLLMGCTDCKA